MLILKGNSTHNGGVTFPSKEGVLDLIQSSPLSINFFEVCCGYYNVSIVMIEFIESLCYLVWHTGVELGPT